MQGSEDTTPGGAAASIGDTALGWAADLAPAFVTLLVVVGVLVGLNRALGRATPGNPTRGLQRQIALLAVTAIGGLLVLLLLPLPSEKMNGLLSLIGLVVSAAIALAATTFISNAMAGVMIGAVGNFKIGDFLKVGEHFGRVTERELFHTEIQTEDRDLLTLPNLYLVTHPVKVVRPTGTILSTTVSLGYDVPRDRVERALLVAAREAGLDDPFVQIDDLLDHSVVYRAAGLLKNVKQLLSSRSRLRAAVLDELHSADIEIVSPAFVQQRVVQLKDVEPVIPTTPITAPGESSVGVESVAFDKAEEVENLEDLRGAYTKLEAELEALDAELDAAGADAAPGLSERRVRLTTHLERLHTRIENKQQSIKDRSK